MTFYRDNPPPSGKRPDPSPAPPSGYNRPPTGEPTNTDDWNAGYAAGFADGRAAPPAPADANDNDCPCPPEGWCGAGSRCKDAPADAGAVTDEMVVAAWNRHVLDSGRWAPGIQDFAREMFALTAAQPRPLPAEITDAFPATAAEMLDSAIRALEADCGWRVRQEAANELRRLLKEITG